MLYEQYCLGPADVVVVVSADGLMAVPSSVHTPSALTLAAESIGANLWLAVRPPLLALTPLSPPTIRVWGCAVWGCGGWDRPDLAGGDHPSEHPKPQ